MPSARAGSLIWFDHSNQELWLFGGAMNNGAYFACLLHSQETIQLIEL